MLALLNEPAKIVGNSKVEQYLTDALKVSFEEQKARETDQEMKEDESLTINHGNDDTVLDDLDAVLNFESKEFSELVSTMDKILSLKKAA